VGRVGPPIDHRAGRGRFLLSEKEEEEGKLAGGGRAPTNQTQPELRERKK